MAQDRTHSWEWVVSSFRSAADENPVFAPLADLAERLAASPYAAGLFPVKSMHSLRIYQHDTYSASDDAIHIDFDFDAAEFVVQYRSLRFSNSYTTPDREKRWTKRTRDGFAAVERCLHHLRWFVEYNGVVPGGTGLDLATEGVP